MLTQFVCYLLSLATYTKDESGYIFANVEGYQGFFSQGETIEEARTNLKDVIESVIAIKLADGDEQLRKQMKQFMSSQSVNYA